MCTNYFNSIYSYIYNYTDVHITYIIYRNISRHNIYYTFKFYVCIKYIFNTKFM